MGNKRIITLAHALAIAILTAIVYSNTMNVPFYFDDDGYIVNNPLITDLSKFGDPEMVSSLNMIELREFYETRKVALFSFALNYSIHGLDVRGYHVFNLIIHVISSLLVYRLISLTLTTPPMRSSVDHAHKYLPLIISLLFAVHPVNTQAVTYISQRFASMCAMFYLASMVFYIQSRLTETISKYVHYALSLIFAVLAMRTKEIAFTLPVAILMYEMMFLDSPLKRRLMFLVPLLTTMLIIPISLMARTKGAGEAFGMASKGAITSFDYLITQIRVIATYLRLLILPINQNLDYDYPIYKTIADPNVILSILLHAAIIALGVWMFVRSKDKPLLRFASFGIFWFYLTLSVESSIIPIKDVIFEHRVYLPSLGMVTAIVSAGYAAVKDKSTLVKKTALAASVVIILSFAAAAYLRNNVWQNELSLWSDSARKSPNKARPLTNLANVYLKNKQTDRAFELYKKAAESGDPDNAEALHNLALIYEARGRLLEAEWYFNKSLDLGPDPITFKKLGDIYMKTGRTAQAVLSYKESLKVHPYFVPAMIDLCRVLRQTGEFDKAVGYCSSALKINPGDTDALIESGLAYFGLKSYDEASAMFRSAIAIKPDSTDALNGLGAAMFALGNYGEAVGYYEKAVIIDPDFTMAYFNLGEAYLKINLPYKAIEYLEIYISKDPRNAEARVMLDNARRAIGAANGGRNK